MAIVVDIADRLYDYTDEKCALEAIRTFQEDSGLSDQEIVSIWEGAADPRRAQLEALVFNAIDANGSVKRANESVPSGITLTAE